MSFIKLIPPKLEKTVTEGFQKTTGIVKPKQEKKAPFGFTRIDKSGRTKSVIDPKTRRIGKKRKRKKNILKSIILAPVKAVKKGGVFIADIGKAGKKSATKGLDFVTKATKEFPSPKDALGFGKSLLPDFGKITKPLLIVGAVILLILAFVFFTSFKKALSVKGVQATTPAGVGVGAQF